MADTEEIFEVGVYHSISRHSDPPSENSDDERWDETVDSSLDDSTPHFMPTSDLLRQSSKLKKHCPQASVKRSLSRKIMVRVSKLFVSIHLKYR